MPFIFKGNLSAYLCLDCKEHLAFVTVRLYRLRDNQKETMLAAAETKHTINLLDKKQIAAKKGHLIAEVKTDENGNFTFELNEKREKYQGEAFELDVYLTSVAGQSQESSTHAPVQFTITTLQPRWRQREKALMWYWTYCLPSRFWCRLRERFGVWVICGRVIDCESQFPIPAAKVTAFDRDWLQDDELGSVTTDSNGRFRIYYPTSAFQPGTLLDIEMYGGPDLYFHVETTLGAPLLIEPAARGRDPDRENVGPCFCVTLCTEEPQESTEPQPLPVFSHLGGYNYEDDINSLPAQSGLTKSSNRAFFSSVRLNGVLPKKLNNQPMEFRFETQEIDATGAPLAAWTPVVMARIAKTKIGVLERRNPAFPILSPNPIKTLDYIVGAPSAGEMAATVNADSHGDWIQVPQESSSALGPIGFFSPNGNMIRLITASLAAFPTINLETPGPLIASQSATSTGQALVQNRHYSIRMQVREVGTGIAGVVAGSCQNVAIENSRYRTLHHPAWMAELKSSALAVAMVDVEELILNGCSGINTTLTVNYTAAHPNLGSISIGMKGPGGPYSLALTPDGAASADNQFGTATLAAPLTVNDLAPCAYIVKLSVQVLLTTGDWVPDHLEDEIAFCKT